MTYSTAVQHWTDHLPGPSLILIHDMFTTEDLKTEERSSNFNELFNCAWLISL